MRELIAEPLAPRTTFGIGGPARRLLELEDEDEVATLLRELRGGTDDVIVLGEGSNVLIADEGLDAVVLRLRNERTSFERDGSTRVLVHADAGLSLDTLVARSVAEGLSGIEALAGIPGSVGASPVQNVGAYGQQIADSLQQVRVVDRTNGDIVDLPAHTCNLTYRQSAFKTRWSRRYVITRVTFSLSRALPAPPRHGELARALADLASPPTATAIREAVLALRRPKGMVRTPNDPNSRSAGSFFVNPIVSPEDLDALRERARRAGLLEVTEDIPHYPAPGDRIKLAAAWLIEHAGFARGYRHGHVGLSAYHTLAIINRGGGSAREVVALAETIQNAVWDRFQVALHPEPVFFGLPTPLPPRPAPRLA